MKRNPITMITGVALLVIFIFLVFAFQVRFTQVAVVTRFGRYSRSETNSGLFFRLPPGVEKVYYFDKRLQNFERKFEQTFTRDKRSPIVAIYVAWRIADPKMFLERFNSDDVLVAEQSLEGLVRGAQNAVIGRHDFSELVSPDPTQVKFDVIEREIQEEITKTALSNYGIAVDLVGIKQLGLPETLTAKVFDRMRAERERTVKKLIAEGNAEATKIYSQARLESETMFASAQREALKIRGEAEAKELKSYEVFNQEPELAQFFMGLRALELSLTNRSTLILDESTAPLNLLKDPKALKIQ
ncbi:MAG TPA: protease modulator HflC [Candidatus Limnocylindria bacterium]|jgi:membrane protease subunit HflC|nr:protease modulator HflC [Candidatus Limnocylindria bacterium]